MVSRLQIEGGATVLVYPDSHLTTDWSATEAKYRRLGRRYGYPECCIEQFIADRKARRSATGRTFGADGRLLCDSCAVADA